MHACDVDFFLAEEEATSMNFLEMTGNLEGEDDLGNSRAATIENGCTHCVP